MRSAHGATTFGQSEIVALDEKRILLRVESSALPRDTARAMSQENVDVLKRGMEASNAGSWRRPWSCWIPRSSGILPSPLCSGGETTVFRGHDGAREVIRQF